MPGKIVPQSSAINPNIELRRSTPYVDCDQSQETVHRKSSFNPWATGSWLSARSESKTAGGIVLPDTAKDKPSRGTIIAIGNGRLLDDGTRSKPQVKVGDKVLFTTYAPRRSNFGNQELLLMREEDILAVIE